MKTFIAFFLMIGFSSSISLISQSIPRDTILKIIKRNDIAYFKQNLAYEKSLTGNKDQEILQEIFMRLDTCEIIDFYAFLKNAKYKIPAGIYSKSVLYKNACLCGDISVVKGFWNEDSALTKRFLTLDNFFFACKSGNLELVKYLISMGSPYGDLNKYERSAVMAAVCSGNLSLIKYLIEELKLNPDQLDFIDERAISLSVRHGMLDITKYLYNKKRVEYEEDFIQNLFQTAAYFNNIEVFKFLNSKFRLSPCSKNLFEENIYLEAIRHCKIDTNFFNLLPTSPCMNDVDSLGENIAFKCTYDSVMFKYLYSKGVSYNIFNRNGNTPAAQTIHDLVSSLGDFEELTGNDLLSVQQDILGQIYCMSQKGVSANREDPIFYLFKMLPEKNRSVVLYFKSKGIALSTYTNKNGDRLLDYLRLLSKDKLIELIAQE